MGTYKLNILFLFSLALAILFPAQSLLADAGDEATNWVEQNTRSLSINLCQENAKAIVNTVYGHFYQKLLEIDTKLKQIKLNSIRIPINTIVAPQKFEFANFYLTLDALIQTERKTLEFYDYELALFVEINEISRQLSDFQNDWRRVSRKDNWDFRINRPIMNPDGVIQPVKFFDGIEVEFDSHFVSSSLKMISKGLKSIVNIFKNIKTNKKIKKAKNRFYELQVSEAEFEQIVEDNFFEKREELFRMTEESLIYAGKTKEDIKEILTSLQNNFLYLDETRERLIVSYYDTIFQAKLAQEQTLWSKQETQLFLLDLELELEILRSLVATNQDSSLTDSYQRKFEILEKRLLDYKRIFGEIK